MTTTKQWEPALYLDTEEARQAYLKEALSEANGDPTEVLRALGVVARAKGLPQIADEIGVSKQRAIQVTWRNRKSNLGDRL